MNRKYDFMTLFIFRASLKYGKAICFDSFVCLEEHIF
jgi:hypothetical protein